MSEQTIPIQDAMKSIVLRAYGNLSLKGWDRSDIQARSDDPQGITTVQTEEGQTVIKCLSDYDLMVPTGATLVVEKVGGNAFITGLTGPLSIHKVGGNLGLKSLQQAQIDKIGGNCLVQDVSDLQIVKIGGNLAGSGISTLLVVEKAGGEIQVATSAGSVRLSAGGDVALILESNPTGPVAVRAGGEIHVGLPADANLSLAVHCGGEIHFNLGGKQEDIDSHFYHAELGKGGPAVELNSGSSVELTDQAQDVLDRSDILNEMEDFVSDLDSAQHGPDWRPIDVAEQVSRQAERRVKEAMRHMDRRMRHFDVKIPPIDIQIPPIPPVHINVGHPNPAPEPKPQAVPEEAPGREPTTDEERLLILQMVQEKKITVEEAELLLEALEGRSEK